MKKLITTLFLLSSFIIFSQEKTTDEIPRVNKHELSIFTENFFDKNEIYYSEYGPYYYNQDIDFELTKVGFGYRYHFVKSAIRSRMFFGMNNKSEKYNETNVTESKTLNMGVALGYEFHVNKGKSQLFYGADLNYTIKKNNNKTENSLNNNSTEYTSENIAYGVSPLFGIRYFFTPTISFSTELRFNIESFSVNSSTKYSLSSTENTTSESGMKTFFGPKGFISFNFHF